MPTVQQKPRKAALRPIKLWAATYSSGPDLCYLFVSRTSARFAGSMPPVPVLVQPLDPASVAALRELIARNVNHPSFDFDKLHPEDRALTYQVADAILHALRIPQPRKARK